MQKSQSMTTLRSRSCSVADNPITAIHTTLDASKRRHTQDDSAILASHDVSQELAKLTAGQKNKMDFKS